MAHALAMRLIAITLGAACLLAAAALIFVGQSNQSLQLELGRQQDEINKGALCQQVGANLLREMGQMAVGNERMRDLLKRHGFTLTLNPPATPAPGLSPPAASPAPMPPPTPQPSILPPANP